MSRQPVVIGLTGNIATGKSLVGQMCARWGAQHIDADRLAHQVIAKGTRTWKGIIAAFGAGIQAPDGEIDRAQLGAIVFSDADALEQLERLVHPEVIARTQTLIAGSNAAVVVVEAIKLIESGLVIQLCDMLWVVTAPREVQIQRLMEQRSLSHSEAVLRVDAQPPQAFRIARADVIIDNGGSIQETKRQVRRAWAEIRASQ